MSTWCHIPEDGNLHSQKCEKLKSRMLTITTTTIIVVVAAVSTDAVQILSTLNLLGKIPQYRTIVIITTIYSSSKGLHHTKFVSNVTRLALAVHQLLAWNRKVCWLFSIDQKYVFMLYQSCIIVEDSIISLCDRQGAIADSRQLKSMRFG